ncbi:cytochrome c biogenesis protein CcdA [Desulfotomaculum nigrificans]|uniref:cytochrome c biogenesis protein CcdA n=1 Tax=Desulfotomaculum nigrificans TaxID=1565 RepID=UPI0002F6C3A7|nr:cytochrome c biogenesis protein CcdA [Desulfotomaculum nigrificans]
MGIGVNISFWAAFLGGFLSFFSPCILPLLPVYVSQLTASMNEKPGNFRIGWGITLQALIFIARDKDRNSRNN